MLGDPIEETREEKSKVLPCSCEHEYQDQIYGKKMRLHNAWGGRSFKGWRCTVCEKER
jgi:hypothetical protein